MKIFKPFLSLFFLLLFSLSCEDDNSPIFIAHEDANGIVFLNSFAPQYLLSEETRTNIADRLVWNSPEFGVETNINYEIEAALDEGFSEFELLGSTSETNFTILIADLLGFASDLNLDDDPTTTDSNGLVNNSGVVFIRIKASLGVDSDVNNTYTDAQAINISIIERIDTTACEPLYALGDALVDIGWNFPGAELICSEGLLEVKLKFSAASEFPNFKLYQTSGDWNSGLGYTHYTDEGYTIDLILADADDGDDSNFRFIGEEGIYTLRINSVDKDITVSPSSSLWAVGGAVPGGWDFTPETVEFIETAPNVWSASIQLSNDVFRFFQTFNSWDTNTSFGAYEAEGFTIDSNFENDNSADENFNFIGTPGTYTLTIDAVYKEIRLD